MQHRQVQISPADADDKAPQPALLPDFCSLPMALGVVLYGELLAILLALASPSPLAEFWVAARPAVAAGAGHRAARASLLCVLRAAAAALDGARGRGGRWGSSSHAPRCRGLCGTCCCPGPRAGSCSRTTAPRAADPRRTDLGHRRRADVALPLPASAVARPGGGRRQRPLQTLQARIRPHFLFNSMNTIASLTQTDPRLAEEVVRTWRTCSAPRWPPMPTARPWRRSST
jgi:two-component system sensor histidine kinase AlgZ